MTEVTDLRALPGAVFWLVAAVLIVCLHRPTREALGNEGYEE